MSNDPTNPFHQEHALPQGQVPREVGPHLEAFLNDLQQVNHGLLASHRQLHTPPLHRVYDFTASQLTHRNDVGESLAGLGFGIYNAYACKIYVGVGGATPRPGTGSIEVPGKCFLVMPLYVQDVELAADASDLATLAAGGTSSVTVHFLRFRQVPAPFMEVLP